MPKLTFDGEQATYGDWSNNATDAEPWRLGTLGADITDDGRTTLQLFLVRPTPVLNTFQIEVDEDVARRLYQFLKQHYGEEQQ